MPMRFDDERLLDYGEMTFRAIKEGEDIKDYRKACADNVADKDPVEAHEIRTGKPWDEWERDEFASLLEAHPDLKDTNPLMMMASIRLGL